MECNTSEMGSKIIEVTCKMGGLKKWGCEQRGDIRACEIEMIKINNDGSEVLINGG